MAEPQSTPEAEAQTSPAKAESPDTPTTTSDPGRSRWAWVVAGILAAIVSVVTVISMTTTYAIPLPEEYEELSTADDEETLKEAEAMELKNQSQNAARLVWVLGIAMALIFGITAGLTSKHFGAAIVGILIAAAAAWGIGQFTADPVRELSQRAEESLDQSDLLAMLLHGIQWALIGVPVIIAVGIGTTRISGGGRALLAVLVAAVVGAVVYVIGGALTDPLEDLTAAVPRGETAIYFWSAIPPLLIGLVLARAKP